jgi:hypothetical protein
MLVFTPYYSVSHRICMPELTRELTCEEDSYIYNIAKDKSGNDNEPEICNPKNNYEGRPERFPSHCSSRMDRNIQPSWKMRALRSYQGWEFTVAEAKMNHVVDLRELKTKAMLWPEPVRALILTSPDTIPCTDFLIKLNEWEKLLKMQKGGV